MYIDRQSTRLDGWLDTVGQVVGAVQSESASRRAADAAKSDSAARLATANASVEAAKLALQAEVLKSQQTKSSVLTSAPVLLGGAAALGVALFFLIKRRKAGRK